MIYKFGEQLVSVTAEEWAEDQVPAVLSQIPNMQTKCLQKQGLSMRMRSR